MLITRIRNAIRRFVENHIISDDPDPQYSLLDRLDGLGEPRTGSSTPTS